MRFFIIAIINKLAPCYQPRREIPMNQNRTTAVRATLGLALIAAAIGTARADADPPRISFDHAYQRMLAGSGAIRAANLDAEAQKLQAEAAQSLGGPTVNLTGAAIRGRTSANLDISGYTGPANQMIGKIATVMPALRSAKLPTDVTADTIGNTSASYLGVAYPLYTGGKFQALHEMMDARAEEAGSAARETEERTTTQLVKRYFGAQLAHRLVGVRSDATRGIGEHQHTAQRFEQQGLIARTDRLRTDVALTNAQRDERRSRSDAELADIALGRMVNAAGGLRPTTPLFVDSAPIEPLQTFIDRALEDHPAFAKIAGKRHQAEALHRLDKAQYAPDVFLVGNYQLSHGGTDTINPAWGVGIVVSIKLLDQIDRATMLRASKLEEERADVAREQAILDISTQVEMNWRAVEQARERFLSMAPGIELAAETVKLAEHGFREGQATSLDVVDARLQLAKIQTERAQAAYDYDVALAQLLESAGATAEFGAYAARADIHLEQDI
jgi:outer membrane protein TolC